MNIKNKKVSMQDIANKMNIAKSTVSVAISDGYGVSEEVRLKIILTAMEMGYDFGKNYKHKRRKNKTITLILGVESYIDSEFWGDIIRSIEKELMANNFSFNIIVSSSCKSEKEILAKVCEAHSVGIVLIADVEEKMVEEFSSINLPLVLIDAKGYVSLNHSCICADNYTAGIMAGKKLIENGHKHIAFFGQKNYSYSFKQRANGFLDSIEGRTDIILDMVSFPEKADAVIMSKVIETLKSPNRPTGAFCGNDVIAIMVSYEAEKLGLKVPQDLSLIGFDNIELKSKQKIDLTTFAIDKQQIGLETVRVLMDKLADSESSNKIVSVKTTFIEGATLKNLNKQ